MLARFKGLRGKSKEHRAEARCDIAEVLATRYPRNGLGGNSFRDEKRDTNPPWMASKVTKCTFIRALIQAVTSLEFRDVICAAGRTAPHKPHSVN